MTTTSMPGSAPAEPETFEACMAQLEEMVRSMESERLPLDHLLSNYGQGVRLLNRCQEMLDQAQQKIERITSGKSGLDTQPFDPEDAESPSPPPPKPKASKKSQDEARLL